MKKEILKQQICPECGSTNIRYNKEDDELVCNECGAIFAELEPKTEKEFEKAAK